MQRGHHDAAPETGLGQPPSALTKRRPRLTFMVPLFYRANLTFRRGIPLQIHD